jgi:hypothetical protein
MYPVTEAELWLLRTIQVGLLVLQLWAFADCATRRAQAFTAAGKLSKPAWLGITGFAAVLMFFFGLGGGGLILVLIGLVASLVYLTDVRPAVREISGPSRW